MTVRGVISQQGTDLSPLINDAAATHGLPTQALTAQLWAESALDELAERDGVWPDWSVGLGQQTGKYAVVGDGTAAETNKQIVRAYYFQPANAIRECARQLGAYYAWFTTLGDAERYYEAASRYNGGPALAFADNPNQHNIMAGWATAAQYEEADMPSTWVYHADMPPVLQTDPWSCSIAASAWLLRSIGLPAAYPDLESPMRQAGLATPADGLEDGSGSALAAWLRATYGLPVQQQRPVTWAWLTDNAGCGPIIMGGANIYHWVGVRETVNAGLLDIANPAPGYKMLGQTMTEEQFNAFGPWAAVWVEADTEDAVTQAEYDALKAQYDDLNNYTSSLTTDTLKPTVAELHAAAADPKAKRADLQATLERVALRLQPFVGE